MRDGFVDELITRRSAASSEINARSNIEGGRSGQKGENIAASLRRIFSR